MRALLAVVLTLLLLVGCSKPQAPTITPQRVEFVSSNLTALVVRIHGTAHNPNGFALPVRSVDGKVSIAGSPLGSVSSGTLPTLGAKADTPVVFDLSVPWANVAPVVLGAPPGDEVPYRVEGTAHFEAAGLKLSTTFSTQASVKKAQLLGAALRSVPSLPGLPTLP